MGPLASNDSLPLGAHTLDLSVLQVMERRLISDALIEHDGSYHRAARALRVPATTLPGKIRAYGLTYRAQAGPRGDRVVTAHASTRTLQRRRKRAREQIKEKHCATCGRLVP